MNEILFRVLIFVVTFLSLIITTYLVPYLKSLVDGYKYEQLLDTVKQAVEAMEQTVKESGQGKVKKAQVIAFVTAWLNEHNIQITEKQLDVLIEAAVHVMNKKDENK